MKDKTLIVKVDENFIGKVDYLQRINDYKNRSDCVRKVVEKEYKRERSALCEECEQYRPKSSFCKSGYMLTDELHECALFRRKKNEHQSVE